MSANIDTDSPYYIEGGEPTLLPSFVCFADILGYSQLSRQAIASGQGNEFLRRLSSALTSAYREMRQEANGFRDGDQRQFDIKIFTDNIVIGFPVDDVEYTQGEWELGRILNLFAKFQMQLARDGFLLRGGIAFGEHYMDNDIVYGDALISAVSLDSDGGPPYLSLDDIAIKRVQGQLAFYGDATGGTPQHYLLRQDSDGKVFLHYLFKCEEAFPHGPINYELLSAHRRTIESGLDSYRSVPSVRSKYEWLARYHNYFCRELAKDNPVPQGPDAHPEAAAIAEEAQKALGHLINIESFAAEPGPLTLEPVWRGGDM